MYLAKRTQETLSLNGKLTDPAWKDAEWSTPFIDMKTGAPAVLETRAAILWNDTNLYVGFKVEEPFPTAVQTLRDSIIFRENDVELFIDGGDCYYELEINALNTVYEVFFIWRDAYKRGGRFDIPEFDLLDRKGFSFAGDFDRTPDSFWWGTHPRGPRWAFLDWDMPGLQTAVHIDGELNNPGVRSTGWSVEVSIPWSSLNHLASGRQLPPAPGDRWRMFLGRFQNFFMPAGKVQAAWCLDPHGVYDTHQPEKFTEVVFV